MIEREWWDTYEAWESRSLGAWICCLVVAFGVEKMYADKKIIKELFERNTKKQKNEQKEIKNLFYLDLLV